MKVVYFTKNPLSCAFTASYDISYLTLSKLMVPFATIEIKKNKFKFSIEYCKFSQFFLLENIKYNLKYWDSKKVISLSPYAELQGGVYYNSTCTSKHDEWSP